MRWPQVGEFGWPSGGRQPKPVSGFSGGEEGGYCRVLIAEHDGAMLASKCEIYQVNSGKLGLEVAAKPPTAVMATRACGSKSDSTCAKCPKCG